MLARMMIIDSYADPRLVSRNARSGPSRGCKRRQFPRQHNPHGHTIAASLAAVTRPSPETRPN
jgi:hypothetical protein